METRIQTFRDFLETAFEAGNYATDDTIAFVLPLFKEVVSFHEADLVGPFEKEESLFITDERLDINEDLAHPARLALSKVVSLSAQEYSEKFNIIGNIQLDTDVDGGSQQVKNLHIHVNTNEPLLRPAYITGYRAYELLLGHHDAQTDIFCLGLVLASVSLGLNLYDDEDLKLFVEHRESPAHFNPRLHPTLCTLITQMTALDRSKRTQDLYEVIHKLEHYRDYDPEKQTDLSQVAGWITKELTDKSQFILNKLRNRLFDTSHRNRLLYYKPNARFMNLTISSVPMVLRYQSIRPELLFTWNDEISGKVKGMKEIVLNKYLRFEDHQYIPGALDKIRVESQRDIHEYGFSQLKLVITFLNWHNLKEDQHERIQSPLLLIPVELKRNKKLKEDHYVLKVLDNEAEVNPVLANHLRELYGIKLPDFVDLDEMSLEQFYGLLKAQIDSANQGITLNYIDRPRIKLVHSIAKQTVSHYKKRLKRAGNTLDSYRNISYSYQQEHYKPLGLEIFRQRVEPRATLLEFLINDDIKLTSHQLTGSNGAKERQLFELSESEHNPYSWDFDLCNIVVGNFNYKKMSLVRDYNQVIDQQVTHPVFENLFSNQPKQHHAAPYDLNKMEDWYHVITADPTQTKAILQSRTGESYIIQGPPGTGKSQTITNLIADFVAQGKSVLFVCEKRAALDVVYHRLKQQGLDELCCYIHDSQGDKRDFIRNLKSTYEDFNKNQLDVNVLQIQRADLITKMQEQLDVIRHFHVTHATTHPLAGMATRKLIEKAIVLKEHLVALQPSELELLPHYKEWLTFGESVKALADAFNEAGMDDTFAAHPLSRVKDDVFLDENPVTLLKKILQDTLKMVQDIRHFIDQHNLTVDGDHTITFLKAHVDNASLLHPLVESHGLALIDPHHATAKQFELDIQQYKQLKHSFSALVEQNTYWRTKFSEQDTLNALALASTSESAFLGFLNSNWRKLKKQLQQCYDFSKHHVRPRYSAVLEQLKLEYEALRAFSQTKEGLQLRFGTQDIEMLYETIRTVRMRENEPGLAFLLRHESSTELIKGLYRLNEPIRALDAHLQKHFYGFTTRPIQVLQDELESLLANVEGLPDVLHGLRSYASMPESIKAAIRTFPLSVQQAESAIAHKTLLHIYAENKRFTTTDSLAIEKAVQFIQLGYKQLLKLNAELIRAGVRQRFLSHVELGSKAISQLDSVQRQFKKDYNEGRKILENEFGKSMRYKSICELSAKESRLVLKDLKPIWLMSPLSVSDSLPLNIHYFDTIIYDEASQITLEEGIPALYRAPQTIIVGDDKQMPPTNFFTARTEDPDDLNSFADDAEDELLSNDADSLLVQGARKLSSVMLGWHYRSRYETLISYSNHAFYNAALLTIPDKTIHHTAKPFIEVLKPEDALVHAQTLFDRSISFHHLPNSIYEKRINTDEARYIAQLVRELLRLNIRESIGIVAFSQEQQHAIEDALVELAATDRTFEQQLDEAYARTEEDQFIGLFVKNLENVQGDERDIIIMSVCYGFDSRKKMIMNFGPINKKGGEKRLNVIFSRAKKHMAIVSSIRHHNITNEYNEGASYFKHFLQYAALISEGNTDTARTVLDSLVVNQSNKAATRETDVVLRQIKQAIASEGYAVAEQVGHSNFKCSLAVKAKAEDEMYTLGILIDDDQHYGNTNLLEQYYQRPAVLQGFGWRVLHVFAKDWLTHPQKVLKQILRGLEHEPERLITLNEVQPITPTVVEQPIRREQQLVQAEEQTATPYTHLTFESFAFTDTKSNKFWEAALEENKLIVRFGRIGTKGQIQVKTFASPDLAQKEKEKLVREKVGKGYKSM